MHILTFMTCILNLREIQDASLLWCNSSQLSKPNSTQLTRASIRTKKVRPQGLDPHFPFTPSQELAFFISYFVIVFLKGPMSIINVCSNWSIYIGLSTLTDEILPSSLVKKFMGSMSEFTFNNLKKLIFCKSPMLTYAPQKN